MFTFFRKKNWRYVTIAPQVDGGIIVSPGWVHGGSFRLTEDEIEPYLAWEARRGKTEARIGWLFAIVAFLILLLSMDWYPMPAMFVLIGLIINVVVMVTAINKWKMRSFAEQFPNFPPARDDNRRRRSTNYTLVGMSRWWCIISTVVLWWAVWGYAARLVTDTSEHSALDILDHILFGGVVLVLAAYGTSLCFEHFRFRRRHGRAPNRDDIASPF